MRPARLLPLIGLTLLLGACGAGDAAPADSTTTSGGSVTSAAPATETAPQPSEAGPAANPETPAAGAGTASSGRPAAPDFTLALDGGGEFRLADEARPVFMVFWAEW